MAEQKFEIEKAICCAIEGILNAPGIKFLIWLPLKSIVIQGDKITKAFDGTADSWFPLIFNVVYVVAAKLKTADDGKAAIWLPLKSIWFSVEKGTLPGPQTTIQIEPTFVKFKLKAFEGIVDGDIIIIQSDVYTRWYREVEGVCWDWSDLVVTELKIDSI